MKRFISTFLTTILLSIFFISNNVEAIEAFDYNDVGNVYSNGEFTYCVASLGIIITSYDGDSSDVTIPDEIDGKTVVTIDWKVFHGKEEQIKTITIGQLGGYYCLMFNGLTNLENIYVDENNGYYKSVDGVLYSKDMRSIYRYPAAKGDKDYTIKDGVDTIDYYTFYDAHLDNIYLPNSITSGKYIALDSKTNLIRKYYSVGNIYVSSLGNIVEGKPVNISFSMYNYENSNKIQGLLGNIKIEGEDGFTQDINKIKINDKGMAIISYTFPKKQKYKITACFTDDFSKCLPKCKNVDVIGDNFTYNMSVTPKDTSSINEEVNLTYDYGNNSLYSFSVEHNGNVQVLSDFSENNSCKWVPKDGGIYSIYVTVKLNDGTISKRALASKYIVPYTGYSLDDMKNIMYNDIINGDIFDANLYVKDADLLGENEKEYLRSIAWDVCFNEDAISENGYLRVSYKNKIYRINLPYSKKNIEINRKVKDFKDKYIKDNMSELEKELSVIKYVKDTCKYDYDAVKWKEDGSLESENENHKYDESYTAKGAFINGRATCKGYSEEVKILLNSVGIDCNIINSNTLNHVWNIVKIDGEYYQLDVTWIDTTSNGTDNDFFNFSNSDTRHQADDISNLDLYNKCTSNKYDNFIVANYNVQLREMVNFEDDYFYITDVYGNNYSHLNFKKDNISYNSVKFSTGKIASEYSIMQYDKYMYYCTRQKDGATKYQIRRINIETGDIENVKDINDTCKLSIHNNKLILEYSSKEPEEIELYELEDKKYYSIIFKDEQKVLDTQIVTKPEEIKFYNMKDKEGYVFKEWNVENSSLGTVINNSDVNYINSNMVFNAVFEKVDDSDNKDDKNESQDDRDNNKNDQKQPEDNNNQNEKDTIEEDNTNKTEEDNKNNNTFDKLSLIKYASLLIFFGLFMVATKKQKGDKYEF